jgi:flagellar basal-body rod modification protein FlgD
LLTTQLQHQDPLNPTDSSQFTSQLIQLSSVEQQEKTNSQLSDIASALSTVGLSTGVAYLDKTVVYNGSSAPLQNGSANWSYSLNSAADSVKLTVTNSSGQVVYSGYGDTSAGGHSFSWNGTDSNGNQYTDGNYTLNVSALDSSGNTISSSVYGSGKVTGIDSSSGSPVLLVGNASVQLSDVIGVKS